MRATKYDCLEETIKCLMAWPTRELSWICLCATIAFCMLWCFNCRKDQF
ncbi:hypothetical protein RchiOBHm_Chr6g0252271 [Rosa chinensis]|uniref:Uncharacterized protein n=1 Tax=Rosa chinensis TaxID=74649 RepID=A0A2P6PL08_ROSCH|nr:hypothetical protein RchiOBHm_Chr6g0252271 [Rosa chinensis]